jgi:hypothetical protein
MIGIWAETGRRNRKSDEILKERMREGKHVRREDVIMELGS